MYRCESWTIKKAENTEELKLLLNGGVGEDSSESLGTLLSYLQFVNSHLYYLYSKHIYIYIYIYIYP